MSKECIPNCPRIQAAIEDFPEDKHPSVAVAELLEACEATYGCPGPIVSEQVAVVGLIRRRRETLQVYECGLPE